MAIDINIPSQVKNYTNLAGFPATGSLKTIFIAEDTNKTYRWTGSVYVEISGTDTSSLVPTSRTLTINGTTQDLSADRTFTISTGITIGTTAITSGTVGRVLFEGTGNVVSESANLFWDNTTPKLTVTGQLAVTGLVTLTNNIEFNSYNRTIANSSFPLSAISTNQVRSLNDLYDSGGTNGFTFYNNGGTIRGRIYATGNWFIGASPTDAGYKLDVNGTARVQGLITANGNVQFGSAGAESYLRNSGVTAIEINRKNILLSNGADNVLTIEPGNGPGSITKIWLGGYSGTQPLCINGNGREVVFGLDTATPNASSLVRMESTTKGFLPPRMTTTQKNAIASPATGLMVYDTTLNLMALYNGTTWTTL